MRPVSEINIHAVILAGGSGTRFWPASRRLRPKQLLPLGPSAPHTLLASTVLRLEGLIESKNILVATGKHLVAGTQAELPNLAPASFLAEPCAKNTAPCIGWAAAIIALKDPEAIVCVLPSDQHAADATEFRRVLSEASRVAQEGYITTIGIVPTRPETGYGYIQRGAAVRSGAFQVARFVEKPNLETATRYLESGDYLWNAGIFVFRAKDMLAAIKRHLPAMAEALQTVAKARGTDDEEESVQNFFDHCDSVSIDYAVMEKEQELRVVPGDFGWSDLGSWESAWELSSKDESGNSAPASTVLVDARNNLVEDLRSANSISQKVIALVGVEGLCIVETDDALLIMPRERAQDVREVVAELKKTNRTHMI